LIERIGLTELGGVMSMVQPVQMGKRTRMSFARIEEALAVPI